MVVECRSVSSVERVPAVPDVFVAIDTETTGLSPVGDRIVEVAASAFRRDGSEIGSYEQLVDPGIPIPPGLTAIHGITDQMVSGKPGIEAVLADLLGFIGDHVLVAHNASYDVSMLLVPMRRMAAGPSGAGPTARDNLVLDTCSMTRAAFPGWPNYRLGTIADQLGIPRGRAHRAMADVLACKQVFLRILSRLGPDAGLEEMLRMNGSELRLGVAATTLQAAGPPGGWEVLQEAMGTGTPVAIRYLGGSKGAGPRPVTPITLMRQNGIAFLIAHCHIDDVLKHFRLDRIAGVSRPVGH